MRILVCGDRSWADEQLVFSVLDELSLAAPLHLISGGATGADTHAAHWATSRGRPIDIFQAEWKLYGRAAGPIRNQRMLDQGRPDVVLAFHDNLDQSRGTKHMVKIARNAGLPVRVVAHGVAGRPATIIKSASLVRYQITGGTVSDPNQPDPNPDPDAPEPGAPDAPEPDDGDDGDEPA